MSQDVILDGRGYIMIVLYTMALTLNSITFQIDNIGTPDYLYYISMLAFLLLCTSSMQIIEHWGMRATLNTALLF